VERIYIFKRFERFWHWAQAVLIIFLLTTGFEIHGSYALLGWQKAADLHTTAAWTLIGLWLFAIFWHFTTDEWKHYIPTRKNMFDVAYHYAIGIFTGAPHPYRVSPLAKHNPLQRVAYLVVKLVINSLVWISGLAYLYYNELGAAKIAAISGLQLSTIALAHTAAAFMMLAFLIGHFYLATTGPTPFAHIKAMITGWLEHHHPESAHAADDHAKV